MILFGRKAVVGFGRLTENGKPIMPLVGARRDRVGPKGTFTTVGVWPILVAVSARMPNGQRWTRKRAEKSAAWDAMQEVVDDYFAFEAAVRTGTPDDPAPAMCSCGDPACGRWMRAGS